MSLLLVLACGEAPAPPELPSRPASQQALGDVPDCAAYAEDAQAFAYCAYQRVGEARTVEDVQRLCDHAGDWSEECRESWAGSGQHCEAGLEPLLSLCAEDACRFAVVDSCPAEGVLQQVEACERRTGRFDKDCVGHAMQVWLIQGPSPEEIGALMARPGHNASTIGAWAGLAMARIGEGTCAAPPDGSTPAIGNLDWCERSMKRCSTEPDWCSEHWERRF
jgi:hypothetical protein